MTRIPKRIALALTALAVTGISAACSSSAPSSAPAVPASSAVSAASGGTTKLVADTTAELGAVVTDQAGFTLYRFEKDTASPPASNCNGQCAETWPPALADSASVSVSGVDASLVGTVARADGTKQLTIAGHPVYRYAHDTAPGQTNGQGVGGTWYAVTPTGQKAAAPGGAALNLAQSDQLGAIVTDADGFTLYRFDKDSAHPPTTNCDGACATTWPPAIVTSSDITVNGIDRSLVGTITRPDGSTQLTIAGWPVYEYKGDTASGDVNGQGVGGTWHAISPTGQKILTAIGHGGSGASSAAPSASASSTGY
jgi:predicted lipoprotein with Yx(FWY)xxD motif